MTVPQPYTLSTPLDPRLVTKTSLPKPKAAIALLIALWLVNDKPAEVTYGRTKGAVDEGGLINDELIEDIAVYASAHDVELNSREIESHLKENPLLKSQLEALNASFELVWRLGTLSFTDSALNRSSERKREQSSKKTYRFQKTIRFSSNLDLVGILEETEPDSFARVLMNWLTDGLVPCDEDAEGRLTRMLSVFAEPALFKTCKGDSGTVFSISGVYGSLLDDKNSAGVDLAEGAEVQGPTRILSSAIEAGLFPNLTIVNRTASTAEGLRKTELEAYTSRIRVSSQLANVKLKNQSTPEPLNEPRNLIYFGAPGTGKSYELNKLAEKCFPNKGNITRVTFYPDYTYSQFVGCYKPYTNEHGDIAYGYVPGPFLDTYLKASTHPNDQFVLIIEEINRANPAAVFGDVFQLLDRTDDGLSVYSVDTPYDMKNYIADVLSKLEDHEKQDLEDYFDPDLDFKDFSESMVKKLELPRNMYIWATMNSADQGVFPMDTAFKRRWDFRYMGIDEGENADIDGTSLSTITVSCGGQKIAWNDLRKAINRFMLSDDLHINEDKLLGPFFIAPSSLTEERFTQVFKDKVLLYLYEDAGKMSHSRMFREDLKTYSDICNEFDKHGVGVFGRGFDMGLTTQTPNDEGDHDTKA